MAKDRLEGNDRVGGNSWIARRLGWCRSGGEVSISEAAILRIVLAGGSGAQELIVSDKLFCSASSK
jgi:hypothetical protein